MKHLRGVGAEPWNLGRRALWFCFMAVWAAAAQVQAAEGERAAPIATSATPVSSHPKRAGVVRLDGHALRDDSGPFPGLGASYFQALRRAKFDPKRFENDIAFLADNHFNYVRILSMVGWFKGWDGLEIAPVGFTSREGKQVAAWPDYWEQFERMIDVAGEYGLRTQITIFADAQLMPAKSDRIEHMTKILRHIQGREDKIMMLEVANEAWQNGFPGAEGVKQLREFARFLADRTSIPVAITSDHENGEAGAIALYQGSAADIATWHFSRDTRTKEAGWLPVHDCYWAGNMPGLPPFSSNEPIGPGASVSSENDPVKLVMAAAVAWAAKLPMYVYHSKAGVFGGARFEEMPAIGQYKALLKILPADLAAWTRNDGREASAPLTAFADDQPDKWWPEAPGARSGVVRNTGSVQPGGNQFVALPIGILEGGATFQARKAMKLRVYHPLSGAVVTNLDLAVGKKFWLPAGPGAYVIRGEL
jgi:hypothetical protein